MPRGPNSRSWFFRAGTEWGEVIGWHGSKGAARVRRAGGSAKSIRLEGQLGAKWAVGRDNKTLLLTFPLPSRGSSFGRAEGSLPTSTRKARERILGTSSSPKASAWTGGGDTQREVCAGQGHQAGYFGHCQTSLPDPCHPKDQPQRLGRQPRPPFPAW